MQQPQQPGKILRWVKAEERLPAVRKSVWVKHIGAAHYEQTGGWFHEDAYWVLYTAGTVKDNRLIEWLEETEDLSAPTSPVEELAKVKEELLLCIRERNKYLYQLDTLTDSKLSPVIEIGEQTQAYRNAIVSLNARIDEMWNHRGISNAIPDSYIKAINKEQQNCQKVLNDYAASHPAPAPIVGEREEKKMKCEACAHQLSDHNKEGSDVHCGKGHWYGLDDPNTPYPADFDFWHNCEDFASTKPAPIKQALPEETEEKINKSIEWCQGFERATLKFKSLLDAANARIKELQEWHDSHL